MLELIQKGGPIIYVLCFFSIYGLAIIAERLFYFHRIRVNSSELLHGLAALIREQKFAEALHQIQRIPGPVARVIESTLKRPSATRQELTSIVETATELEVFNVEKHIRGLLTVSTVTPLLGLLGTLIALMQFYYQANLTELGVAPMELSEAIFEALITSALGMIIAVPSYLFYTLLGAQSRRVLNEIERAGIETANYLADCASRHVNITSEKPHTSAH